MAVANFRLASGSTLPYSLPGVKCPATDPGMCRIAAAFLCAVALSGAHRNALAQPAPGTIEPIASEIAAPTGPKHGDAPAPRALSTQNPGSDSTTAPPPPTAAVFAPPPGTESSSIGSSNPATDTVDPNETAGPRAANAPTANTETIAARTAHEEPQPIITEIQSVSAPRGGGVAGRVSNANDGDRAAADLEGETLDPHDVLQAPARMPALQAAGWWTLFGAVSLAAAGGVFAGIVESREDELEHLAFAFDTNTGGRLQYEDIRDQYERRVSEGLRHQAAARVFLVSGGVFLVASLALFAAHRARKRQTKPTASRLRALPGGLEFHF